jgi:hypothetical protein
LRIVGGQAYVPLPAEIETRQAPQPVEDVISSDENLLKALFFGLFRKNS